MFEKDIQVTLEPEILEIPEEEQQFSETEVFLSEQTKSDNSKEEGDIVLNVKRRKSIV